MSKKISSSPERHSFQEQNYIKSCEEKGKEPNPDYVNMYKTWREQDEENLKDPQWQRHNLEWDLRSTEWILAKARASDSYAQNIYAALCNQQWISRDLWPQLKEQSWSCSWRSAGGIVADMLGRGDYIDWYCSGIRNEELGNGLVGTIPEVEPDGRTYVAEGHITDEIMTDFNRLGWTNKPYKDNQ